MNTNGTAFGRKIELDEPLPFADGTRVTVTVTPDGKPRKGSPSAVLGLAGTLTAEEARAILAAARECRRIDPSLWSARE
jgi:hypothetical protein